jgi:iron complex outermembrane receptor protein
MKNRITAAIAVISLVMPSVAMQAHAADKQGKTSLDEVVVTATKTDKDTAEAPAAVSVVKAKDIETMNVQSPDEALKYLPGAYATRVSGHEPSVMSTNVLLRGIPDYSRTLVLVDGQKLNDPFIGAVTWESVLPETIERIEVVPGPFSSLYGGSAMGGVINIITKTPTKREFLVKTGYGTDDLKSATFVYQDRLLPKLGILLDYSYKGSGGFIKDQVVRSASNGATGTPVTGWQGTTDPYGTKSYLIGDKGKSPWESQNAGLKLFVDLPMESKLTLGFSHFSYKKEWDRFDTYLKNSSGAPVSSGAVTFNDNANKTLTATESLFLAGPNPKVQNRYTLDFDTKISKDTFIKANFGYTDIPDYDYVIPLAGATFDSGGPGSLLHRPNSEISGSVQVSRPFSEKHLIVAGISAGKREIKTFQYSMTDWRDVHNTGAVQNRTAGQDQTYSFFIQDEIYLAERLTAYLGGRYDLWDTEGFIEQVKAPAYKNDYSSRSQDHFSPKASLVYRPFDKTTLRLSAGNSFRAPVLRDTFGWWTPATGKTYVPNPDLKPETMTSWEAGVEQKVGTGTLLRATYYENKLDDLIYRTEDATTQSIANAGEALIKGIELEIRQRVMEGLNAFANYTYNDARITRNAAKPATEGKFMTQTPRTISNVGLQCIKGPWSASLAGHYVGKVYANDENKDVVNGVYGTYDPYFTMDAKASYQLKKLVTLSLSADNLLDRKYYQSTLAQGRAFFGEVTVRF